MHFLIDFQKGFSFTEKQTRKYRVLSHMNQVSPYFPLLLTSCFSVVHLIQIMNLVLVYHYSSLQFTLGALCVIQLYGFCHVHNTVSVTVSYRSLIGLQMACAPPTHPFPHSPPMTTTNLLFQFCFSKMSYNWICNLYRLASLTWQYTMPLKKITSLARCPLHSPI